MADRRIARCFDTAQKTGNGARKMIIPFITAGDPDLPTTLSLMNTLVDAGADIIELGVPFSDPMADGPVIQAANERALKHQVSLEQIIDLVAEFRQSNETTPIVLMGYMNPIETMGYKRFAEHAAAAGVDGVLTVDLPPEEAEELVAEVNAKNIDTIFLLSPTSPDNRIKQVCEQVSGYVYYVSLKGVTGAANLDVDEVSRKVTNIKSMSNVPVAVGFGIRDAESAKAVASTADGIVVGSALVSLVAENAENVDNMRKSLFELVNAMRVAVDEIEA